MAEVKQTNDNKEIYKTGQGEQNMGSTDEKQYVAFELAHEEYAVDILSVREIIRRTDITRVPKAPPFVKGVINLRGTIIPVIDSHLRFKLHPEEITDNSRIVVFNMDDITIGMTVDYVTEVLRLSEDQIEKQHSVNSIDNLFIKGIGKVEDRLLIILNLEKVLDLGTQQAKE